MATTPKGIYYPNNYNEIADIPEDMKKMAESIDGVFEDTDSDLSDIQEEQTIQNNRLSSLESDNTENKANIQENANNINQLSRRVQTNETNIASLQLESGNTLELSLNNTTYELTATLKNKAGTTLSTSKVDFPVEQLVISVTYDSAKKELVITLKNGQITRVPIGSIINGLVNQSDFDALVQTVQTKANQSDLNQTNTNVTNLAGRVSNNESKIENIEQEQTEQNTNISTNATNIESLQEENENLKKIVSQLPQVTGQGIEVTLENTIEAPFTIFDVEGNSVQDGTPSPDNEVPIKSAGDNGSINEKIQNKNWLNKNSNFKTYNASVTPIDTGIKVENNDGGTYRSVWCEIGKDELLGKTLTIQTSISTYNGAIPRIMVVFNNETTQYIENIKTITDTTDGTIVNIPNSFPENADRVSLIFYCSFGSATPTGSYVEYKNLQVELGSIATPYISHEEQTYSIPVQQPMRSIGDVRDGFAKVNGVWNEVHRIGEVVLDGTETISIYNSSSTRTVFRVQTNASNFNVIQQTGESCKCSHFIPVWQGASWVYGNISTRAGEYKNLYITMQANMTVEEFQSWLSINNVIVNMILAEPQDLPCTEEQIQQLENKPSTYKEMTIIQSEDETPAYLEVSGIYDMNKLITRTEVLESEV